MSRRRTEIIEEMGLGPVWRLRSRTAPAAAGTQSAAPAEPSPAVEPKRRAAQPPQRRTTEAAKRRDTGTRGPAPAAPAGQPVPAGAGEREAAIMQMDWPALQSAVASCTACGLAKTRTNTVFGVGDPHAEWLLVGEAPGAEEDARGEPFVGQAGRLLDNMLASIGLARGRNVYIANVLKCRPPGNRNPEPGEVECCGPFLARQIELIRPRLIVAMGRFAVQTLLATDASIASLRGRLHRYQGLPMVVSYHPAYLLRNLPDKAKAWEDLCLARRTLAELAAGGSAGD